MSQRPTSHTIAQTATSLLSEKARVVLEQRLRAGQLRRRAEPPSDTNAIDLRSNDYLGLSHHEAIKEAAAQAVARWGTGSSASPLLATRHDLAKQIIQELKSSAQLPSSWDGLVVSSGFAANLAFCDTLRLLGSDLAIFVDHRAHASLVMAARNSGLPCYFYPHQDYGSLSKRLARCTAQHKVIVAETLHSMEGTFEPIGALAQLCQQHHGTCLFLDEAHSAGTFGHASLALASPQLQNIEPWLIGVMLGCGKSLSSAGGLLLMPQSLCDLGVQGARSYVYSTAPSPSQMAAVLASLVQLRSEGQVLASRLQTHLLDFHSSLKTIVGSSLSTVVSTTDWNQPAVNKVCSPDFDHGPAHNNGPRLEVGLSVLTQGTAHQHLFSPIVTIMIKDHKDAFQSLVLAHQRLEQAGFLTSLVRTPTVPAGQERIRISFSVQKQDGWAARLAWALSDLARQL